MRARYFRPVNFFRIVRDRARADDNTIRRDFISANADALIRRGQRRDAGERALTIWIHMNECVRRGRGADRDEDGDEIRISAQIFRPRARKKISNRLSTHPLPATLSLFLSFPVAPPTIREFRACVCVCVCMRVREVNFFSTFNAAEKGIQPAVSI